MGLHSVDDVLAPENIQFTTDVFSNMPISNIVSEASFAGSHVRRQSSHGNHGSLATVATNHILAASKTDLDLALAAAEAAPQQQRQRQRQRQPGRARSDWQWYMQHQSSQSSMKELAVSWRGLSSA